MRFLIVQTGTTLPAIRAQYGDFPDWIRRDMELTDDDVQTLRADSGEKLPGACNYAGVIVTGSGSMVSERGDWSERTAGWLRDAIDAGVPILGLCYGHQLLAHALGGRVDFNPRGREIGSVEITRLAAAADDALFDALPARFRAQTSHVQSVLELPRGATALARSALDGHQAVRYAPQVWGVQFHPEFSPAVVRAYVSGRADALQREGLDARELANNVAEAPGARSLLPRFAEIARHPTAS